MKKVNITIQYDESKAEPIRKYMNKKGLSLEDELVKILDSYYTKYVPAQVREYFEMCAENDKSSALSVPRKTNQKAVDKNM